MLPRYEFDLSLDIISAVRDAVGPKVDLLIEGHCRFNPATAIEFAMAMHHLRPTWFEEPVPHTNVGAMVEVARRSPVPIATGESLSSKQQFADLLQHNAISILQPEPLNLGGLFATRKIADMVDRPLRHDRSAQRAGPNLFRGMRAVERIAAKFFHP